MKTLLTIDPGKAGGMALARDGQYVDCWKMPDTEGDILELVQEIAGNHNTDGGPNPPVAYIESVHAMPKQGVTSTFTFGRGYGFLLGVLMAYGFRIETVTPQRWQKALAVGKSGSKTEHKNKLKSIAQRLYPGVKVTLSTADALLLLDYAKSQ